MAFRIFVLFMLQHRLQFAKTQSVHDCSNVFCCLRICFVQLCSNFSICVCAPICARKLAFCCVELLPTCPTFVSYAFVFRVGRCRLWGAHRMHDLPSSALQCTVRNEMNLLACSACVCCLFDLLAFVACVLLLAYVCLRVVIAFVACVFCLRFLLACFVCVSCRRLLLVCSAFFCCWRLLICFCCRFLLAFLLAFLLICLLSFVAGVFC